MSNDRNWTKYIGGSEISLSEVAITSAPNKSAPCYGCVFFKQDLRGFYCTFPNDADNRECEPGFGASATVYRKE